MINNNYIQIYFIYVPTQQLQGQLQTQYSADIHNYIMDKHNIKSRINFRNTEREKTNKTNEDNR
jgi:chromosomal replication initiation ATPase DnaA